MRALAVIAIALALLGCGGVVPMPDEPYDYDRYIACVEAYSPEGWASTNDAHVFCKQAARQPTQPTGDPQP